MSPSPYARAIEQKQAVSPLQIVEDFYSS